MSDTEKDIENIKELIIGAKLYQEYEGNKYYKSIENILQDYTRQKQINEENKKYIVKLTDKEYRNLVDVIRKKVKQEFEQKIKDKIEKLRNDIKNQNCRFPYIVEHKIDILQELLQESEGK